jgi:DNA-directed RNA polymerase specialized sigma24 family protein
MAKKLRRKSADDAPPATAADKIARVLALIAVKETETDEAVLRLDSIGFTSREICALLNVSPNYVRVARFRAKKGKKRKKGKTKRAG